MNFHIIFNYLNSIDKVNGDFLEIGSDRGDGSTGLFGSLAGHFNKKLYSVDVDQGIIENNTSKFFDFPIEFFCQKGEEFLDQNQDKKFTFVLLDNFDWQWNPHNPEDWIQNQKDKYQNQYHIDMTNVNSQKAHLLQAIKLTNMLTEQALIICDDTYYAKEYGVYVGKCGAAIPYLETIGFKIMNTENHGVVLSRNV